VADDEGGMRQIEFQIKRSVRRAAGSDDQRCIETDIDRHRQAEITAAGVLDVDARGRNARSRGGCEAGLRIRRHGQQQVAGIAADGEYRAGVGTDRYRDVAENLAEVVELLEIQVGRGSALAVNTVTLLPPACGTSATLSSLTPTSAQSSDDASLTTKRHAAGLHRGAA
jgi:hypothetical protein